MQTSYDSHRVGNESFTNELQPMPGQQKVIGVMRKQQARHEPQGALTVQPLQLCLYVGLSMASQP